MYRLSVFVSSVIMTVFAMFTKRMLFRFAMVMICDLFCLFSVITVKIRSIPPFLLTVCSMLFGSPVNPLLSTILTFLPAAFVVSQSITLFEVAVKPFHPTHTFFMDLLLSYTYTCVFSIRASRPVSCIIMHLRLLACG